ncbi:GNAT family N-acetyltransferase [Clostridium chrysemydis]|uniref:GNAT family N-acetyltransferase n=1 Tax=Clostridium chrysemydis TaxID=2665504 RepID=UPI0018848297|nr:GNAT family protein [Clostridium chrysemydis]
MYSGEKVILRLCSDEILKSLENDFNCLGIEELLYSELFAKKKNNLDYHFAIENAHTGDYIGICSISNTSVKNRNTEISIVIKDKRLLGKGYEEDALKLLVDMMFREYNINKIKAKVSELDENIIKSFKNVGFKEEGKLREEVYKDFKYHDLILVSLFKKDYIENHI